MDDYQKTVEALRQEDSRRGYMEFTPNGFPVVSRESDTVVWKLPRPGGTKTDTRDRTFRLLPQRVGFVAMHFITWYDRTIEPIDPGYDDWGWSYRQNVNSPGDWSNHASASAWDLNALRHPNGERGTLRERDKDKIRDRIEGKYMGLIRPGFDFRSTVDEMHYEFMGSRSQVLHLGRVLFTSELGLEIRAVNPHFTWKPTA